MIRSTYFTSIILILIIFSIDRITKLYVLNLAENLSNLNLQITSYLNIILVWNSGIGFGLFQIDKQIAYNIITILISIINMIIVLLLIKASKFQKILFSMILGGSLGNLYDRIYYTAVPDFIDLNYNGYHWFVFNVADIFITIGILTLIFFEIFIKKEDEK